MNEINTQLFHPRFLSGMVFAMIEGLTEGKTLSLIFENKPEDIHSAIGNAHLDQVEHQLKYESSRHKWIMTISKKKADQKQQYENGSCGVGSGHS